MKKTKPVKTAATPAAVPQDIAGCSAAIATIGVRQRERTRIQAAMNDEIAAIKTRYEAEALPHNEAIRELSKGVEIYCAANRKYLTNDGKVKSHAFAAGDVKWRITPPKVVIRGAEAVLEALRRAGPSRYIRVKEEVSKEAILADDGVTALVPGISIQQSEEFVIEPFETHLEEVA